MLIYRSVKKWERNNHVLVKNESLCFLDCLICRGQLSGCKSTGGHVLQDSVDGKLSEGPIVNTTCVLSVIRDTLCKRFSKHNLKINMQLMVLVTDVLSYNTDAGVWRRHR